MRRMFDYVHFNDEVKDTLVESFNSIYENYLDGKRDTADYQDANKKFSEAFMKECVEAIPHAEFSSLEQLKSPAVTTDPYFLHRFDTILAQAINPVLPTLISGGYDELYEVTQVGWGDNAKYEVKSNELFVLNDAAIGISHGGVLTDFNTEYSVKARKHEIGAYVDWYVVLAGKQDWGHFAWKVANAIKMYVEGSVIKKMAALITANTSPNNSDGLMGYIANGFSDANWVNVAENVKMANGGANVYALGTKIALGNVTPDLTADSLFRYDENSYLVKAIHLPSYKGVSMVEINQALLPNTINGTPAKVVSDNIIYMLPTAMYKPVKVVFEGNGLTVTEQPLQHADHAYRMWINVMVGVDTVVGTKMGAIILQ